MWWSEKYQWPLYLHTCHRLISLMVNASGTLLFSCITWFQYTLHWPLGEFYNDNGGHSPDVDTFTFHYQSLGVKSSREEWLWGPYISLTPTHKFSIKKEQLKIVYYSHQNSYKFFYPFYNLFNSLTNILPSNSYGIAQSPVCFNPP